MRLSVENYSVPQPAAEQQSRKQSQTPLIDLLPQTRTGGLADLNPPDSPWNLADQQQDCNPSTAVHFQRLRNLSLQHQRTAAGEAAARTAEASPAVRQTGLG